MDAWLAEEEFLSLTSPEAIPHIEPLLADLRPAVRAIAAVALANLEATRTARKIAHLALYDQDEAVREAAQKALLKMPTTHALRLLARALLQAEERAVRFRSARILGDLADPRTIPYLIEGLHFQEWFYEPSLPPPERGRWVQPYISGSTTVITSEGTVIISPEIGYIQYGPAVTEHRPGVARLRIARNYQALEALKDMTDEDFHFNKERWRHWWRRNKAELLKPKESRPEAQEEVKEAEEENE